MESVFEPHYSANFAVAGTTAGAFHTNSGLSDYEAAFIDQSLPADCRDTLNDACGDFEASMSILASVLADRVEARAELEDWAAQGMRAGGILDGVVRLKYVLSSWVVRCPMTLNWVSRALVRKRFWA